MKCPKCKQNTIERKNLDEERFRFICKNEDCRCQSIKDYETKKIKEDDAYQHFFDSNLGDAEEYEKIKKNNDFRNTIIDIFQPFKFNSDFETPKKENYPKERFEEKMPILSKEYEHRKKYFLEKFSFPDFIKDIINDKKVIVADIIEIPPEIPEYVSSLEMQQIHPEIKKLLEENGINSLYRYQFEAYQKIKEGKNLIITAPTSSGKTESFMIPILDKILQKDSDYVQAIFIYPVKALTNNQVDKIFKYAEKLGIRIAKLDGDSGKENDSTGISKRDEILNSRPHIILTNLDFIHHHLWRSDNFSKKFKEVISKTKYVVIDEIHENYGTNGSNNAQVIRRMKRLIGEFQLIGLSATLDNPIPFARKFFGTMKIDNVNGSGKRGKMYLFVLFPGILDGPENPERNLMTDIFGELIKNNHHSLCFSNSRMGAEELFIESVEKNINCKIHRAGLLQSDREKVEDMLKKGDIMGVVATPTLQLGIDIGVLNGVVSEFVPFSILKQRIGRAGRGSQENSYGFLILKDRDPISRYYLENPSAYYKDNNEIFIDPESPTIKSAHILFSSLDEPLTDKEIEKEGGIAKDLKENGILRPNSSENGFVPTLEITEKQFSGYSLRDIGKSVKIFEDKKEIGDWDLPMAFEKLHPEAIYLHKGIVYRVTEFDSKEPEDLKCHVKKSENKKLRTQAGSFNVPERTEIIEEGKVLGVSAKLCNMNINRIISEYIERHKGTKKSDVKFISPFKMGFKTIGIEFDFSEMTPKLRQSPDINQNYSATFHTFEHLLIHSSNMLAGGISMDIDGISVPTESKIFIFDRSANGGNGASKAIFENLMELFKRCKEIIENCSCELGCPRCIQYYQCGIFNNNLRKSSVKTFCKIIISEKDDVAKNEKVDDVAKNEKVDDVAKNEDLHNEFKTTFQFDSKEKQLRDSGKIIEADGRKRDAKKYKQQIQKEISIGVSAFANSDGGRLFIGVNDDGKIVGFKDDLSITGKSIDKLRLEIQNSLQKFLKNNAFIARIKLNIINEEYMVLHVPKSNEPIFVNDVNDEVYVRVDNTSKKFTTEEFLKYWKQHEQDMQN